MAGEGLNRLENLPLAHLFQKGQIPCEASSVARFDRWSMSAIGDFSPIDVELANGSLLTSMVFSRISSPIRSHSLRGLHCGLDGDAGWNFVRPGSHDEIQVPVVVEIGSRDRVENTRITDRLIEGTISVAQQYRQGSIKREREIQLAVMIEVPDSYAGPDRGSGYNERSSGLKLRPSRDGDGQ